MRSPNWLGDAVMALPAVHHLKTLLGGEPLAVAAPENLAPLWRACPSVDQVIPLAHPKNLWATARRLRAGKFGSVVLLPNSLRVAAEALLAGIPQRIGYARDGRSFLLTRAVPVPPRQPVRLHQRFYYLDLAAALGGPAHDVTPTLRRDGAGEAILALCPGAEYGPAKRWPVDRFAAVARHFAERHQLRPVIFGAAADLPVAAELAAQLPEAENRTGQTTLAEFMAALAGARLVVCNDSGAMHLASVLGTPTVAVFGSTEPEMTGPLGPPHGRAAPPRAVQPLLPARVPPRFRLHDRRHARDGHRRRGGRAGMKISACLITLNEERNLPRCLQSVAPLADEIVVVDSGSTDRTPEIAREFGARVVPQAWLGYVGQKNFALERASHPWVLSLDADEEISPELAAAISKIKADPRHRPGRSPERLPGLPARLLPRPLDPPRRLVSRRLVRLFRRGEARFTGGQVHEKLEIAGDHPLLPGHLHHFTYDTAADRAERSARYAALWAQSARAQGRRARLWSAPLHAAARFARGYFFRGGFLDGPVGWDIALGNAREVALKYRLLRQSPSS